VQQPNAKKGDRTYCLVSGVAFQITEGGIQREVGGKRLYFCCEACAGYFETHREHVAATRGLRIN
jgi:YHS domain-containing protein